MQQNRDRNKINITFIIFMIVTIIINLILLYIFFIKKKR